MVFKSFQVLKQVKSVNFHIRTRHHLLVNRLHRLVLNLYVYEAPINFMYECSRNPGYDSKNPIVLLPWWAGTKCFLNKFSY